MQPIIISTKNLETGRIEVQRRLDLEKISQFDTEFLEFEKDLGIEDVRNIQKKIHLKPFQGNQKASIWILHSKATTDAQNSLLKLLEEPPASCLIYIISTDTAFFLPTILSRTNLVELKNEDVLSVEGLAEILKIYNSGEALNLAQIISKEKADAIIWLEQTILSARDQMLVNINNKPKALEFRNLIHKLEITHYDLKNTNANPRLALENLFLNL